MKEFDPGDAPSIASITDKVRALPVGMPTTSIRFLGDTAVFVGVEENAALVNEAGEVSKVAIHGGAVLCAASDGKRIVTGGDDGKVVATNAMGENETLATDAKHRWIDRVALGPDAIAWSAGKQAYERFQPACLLRAARLAHGDAGFSHDHRLAVTRERGVARCDDLLR